MLRMQVWEERKREDVWRGKNGGFWEIWGRDFAKMGEQKVWEKSLGVSKGLVPRDKEKKWERKKRGLRGEVGNVFKEKQREQEKRKDLEEKERRNFWIALVRRKRDRDHRSWVDFAEGESISFEFEEHLSKVGSSGYVSGYSQNSCLYSVPLSGRFRMLNVLLIGLDEKGH